MNCWGDVVAPTFSESLEREMNNVRKVKAARTRAVKKAKEGANDEVLQGFQSLFPVGASTPSGSGAGGTGGDTAGGLLRAAVPPKPCTGLCHRLAALRE